MSPFLGTQPWEAPDPLPVMRRELKLLLIEMNLLRIEVEQSRSIREEARAREAFFSASVQQLTEGRDKWRREAERLRDLIEQGPPWSLFSRRLLTASRPREDRPLNGIAPEKALSGRLSCSRRPLRRDDPSRRILGLARLLLRGASSSYRRAAFNLDATWASTLRPGGCSITSDQLGEPSPEPLDYPTAWLGWSGLERRIRPRAI